MFIKKKILKKSIKLYFIYKNILGFVFSGLFFLVIIFSAAALGYLGDMPDLQQLENPKTNLATQIISADGIVLGKYYYNDNRTPLDFDQLPPSMVDALIATEDERYYNHSGIDWIGTLRAIFYFGKRGGASTISQQLARQLFGWG